MSTEKQIQPKPWTINKDCLIYDIKGKSPEWYQFREAGIPGVYDWGFGASECGKVVNAPPTRSYYPLLPDLLEIKAGLQVTKRSFNEKMLSGILAEPMILERWKYWDGAGKSYVDNMEAKRLMRDVMPCGGYIVNKKYPHLFISLDGWCLPGYANLITGSVMPNGFPVEAKTITYFASRTWEEKVPPAYTYQCQQQMLVSGVDYCELACLTDGWEFEVVCMERSDYLGDIILTETEKCVQIVKRLRELKQEMDATPSKSDKIRVEIDSLMPLPNDDEAYKAFYSERMVSVKEAVPMEQEVYEHAVKRTRISAMLKFVEKYESYYSNQVAHAFVQAKSEYMDAGTDGKLRYFQGVDKNGKKKAFQLDFKSFKAKPTADQLKVMESQVTKLIEEILS